MTKYPDFEAIGKRIRQTRQSKGLTQEYLAECADVNTTHISNIENNRVKVSLSALINICNALGVTVDYILSGEYPSPADSLDYAVLLEVQKCDVEMKERIIKIVQALQ